LISKISASVFNEREAERLIDSGRLSLFIKGNCSLTRHTEKNVKAFSFITTGVVSDFKPISLRKTSQFGVTHRLVED